VGRQGLHSEKSSKVLVPRIKESNVVLECRATKFLEYDEDPVILLGEVVNTEEEETFNRLTRCFMIQKRNLELLADR
jgi:flavin reductase (DIM6/NTAB) family NADH-FMN oxidoreductase RutF